MIGKINRVFFSCLFFVSWICPADISTADGSQNQTGGQAQAQIEEHVGERVIQAKKLLDFREMSSDVNWNSVFLNRMNLNELAINDEFIFVVDSPNHRIFKFDRKGKFLAQIGRIGQSDDSFYLPSGIAMRGDRIYILDNTENGGKKIKILDLTGKLIKAFNLKNVWMTSGFFVDEMNRIYVAAVFYGKNSPGKTLVAVYDENGQKIQEFGKVNPAKEYNAFIMLNHCLLRYKGNRIFAAFTSMPKILIMSTEGKTIASLDLLEKRIPEIMDLNNTGKKAGLGNFVKSEGQRVEAMFLVIDFDVDDDEQLFYVTTNKAFLVLNSDGTLKERIRLTVDGIEQRVWKLFFLGGERLAVVSNKRDYYSLVSF